MRSHIYRASLALAGLGLGGALISLSDAARAQAGQTPDKSALTQGFKKGTWDYKSIGPLSFSRSGVLFFADDQAGAVYGVDLDEKPSSATAYSKVPDLGTTLAARMGTTDAGIQIKDIAVSPISKNVYISVRKTDGGDQNAANPANYALFAVEPSGKVMPVDLTGKAFGKATISAVPGRRDTRLITDITYAGRKVLVAALSNEQFNSNLVSVPVPFKEGAAERFATSIYHVSHKKQETASPIQTLTLYRDGDKQYLMAAYVCTPVVRFNLEDLKPGQVATGVTVAELGNGNQPMNMIAYGQPGEQSLLLNNSRYGIMKVGAKIAKEQTAVDKAAADRGNGGMTSVPGIEVVTALKDAKAYATSGDSTLVVVKPGAGGMALETMPLP